jgi:hypothetical protein
MTLPPDPPASKGKAMIASYRAARFSQRPALRATLRQGRKQPAPAREGQPPSAEPPEAAAPPPPEATAPATHEAASVFAGLVSLAVAERVSEAAAMPPVTLPPVPQAAAASPAPEPPPPELPPDPPLAEIGFGPGMLIRLSHLGVHTVGDLARADPAGLRQALGDISRLVDVETWINNARQKNAASG